MKNKIKYTFIYIFILFLSSCTDIIQLKLKSTEPRIVIEANLNASDSTCSVKVTKSNAFYDNSAPELVSDLNIIITNNTSKNILNLTEIKTGEYFVKNIIANPNDKYTITITDTNSNIYSATAITPSKPNPFLIIFNSFSDKDIIVQDSLGRDRTLLIGLAYWTDIPNEDNYYRYKIYIGNKYQANSYVFMDDKTAFGDTLQRGIGAFYAGDTVTFDLLTINEETYIFFQQLQDVLNSGMNSTTPYNPTGNFDNGALGYFCIQQVLQEQFIVQKFPGLPKNF